MMQHIQNETLIDYMHGGLSPEADAAVYAHLERCPECRAQFDGEAALTEMLRSYAAATDRDLPATLKAEIWSRVRSSEPSLWSRLRESLRPVLLVPTGLALAVAAYFGATLLTPHSAPMIEAAYYLQDHAALNSTVPFSDRSSSTPVDLENGAMVAPSEQTAVNIEPASYTADAGP